MIEMCSKCLFVRCIWLFVCSFHVTYAFQSASTLYSCLNVKELFAQSRLEIWSLSDCNWTRTQNHLVPWHSGDYRVWIHSETLRDMTRTYSQMHRTNNYSEQSSIIWPVWTNGWVFFYELNGSGFEYSCIHLNFRFRACFEQGVPWHSGNNRVRVHSETHTWHDKNKQLNAPYK